ncbi:polysaccharide biosynthesis tyrosine autokinase [Nocardioides dongxiaopingii]|uniref:polysaccharide biosynthesis tyrosine autokinase n=1 Tax=Nocardioides dongxiaopingii TaxID=2576036 RepID=UPI0010C766C3|nr:polysaccharide biosynthesis tyrosine autokinase [Nocardioides dongxiaopingii]
MELRDYWRTLRRRWKMIVACVVLAVGAAGLLTWQTTPLYASSAQLFVSTAPSDAGEAYSGGLFATQRVTSYVDLVDTRKLSEQVATDLGGDLEPAELRAAVSAQVVPETVTLVVTAQDADAVVARDIAQAYAEALIDLIADIETPDGGGQAPIRASIVDNADTTSSPVSPNTPRNLGLALVLGLLVGVGLAVLRELLDTSLTSSDDIAAITDTPILGHINVDTVAIKKQPAQALSEASPWAESFRVLRTNMQYVEVDHDHRTFVVSSSLPAEGKSTTAVNLAITMAMAGQRVALVECDLRRPLIADRLGLDDAVGTTSVLIGRIELDDALQGYADTGLQVLTCGPRPPNPSELLQSHAMAGLISDLRDRFDVVLLDAPPLLPVTDAALLAAQSDGMLVVVRHGKTNQDQLRHALERVEAVDAKAVGVVVNLAPSKKSDRSYSYGYGYGYSYAPKDDKKSGRVRPVKRAAAAGGGDRGGHRA